MTTTRRDFVKNAALLGGLAALNGWPESIRRAMAIEPAIDSTYLDAEHIVILMQENRSFDHTFGTLRGVRGFNDPRAITLPDGCPVWAQADAKGRRFVPFRMDIQSTKATWMGSLPHSWADQVDAFNQGRYDKWLDVKDSGNKDYADLPLTLGHYSRDDIPFYYALADAFTVCDYNFCSTLTGTTPNRLHLWTGTVRAEQSSESKANVLNSDVDYWKWADWKTFPERLEDLGISWKTYQNEISLKSGLKDEHHAWLANFEDNPLEWFKQYGVLFSPNRRRYVRERALEIRKTIDEKSSRVAAMTADEATSVRKETAKLEKELSTLEAEMREYTQEKYDALPERVKRLHERAFATNASDPDYRDLTEITYRDGHTERRMLVPKGDSLHQFRRDVEQGKLPTVSWLVPSERFSDHPSSAWYGAWYLSEVLDILTKNPEVWRKTVFILTYDENDGYFDHVPPFVAPNPKKPDTGKVSGGIDASLEFVTLEQDRIWHPENPRESAMGLGFRVPMVIASPWSRGGAVCSQVFDHTSVLQFVEKVLSHRTGKQLREPNINGWRRAVCGDLTSCFREASGDPVRLEHVNANRFLPQIHKAQFKDAPRNTRALSQAETEEIRLNARGSGLITRQEPGTRPSCPLPYEMFVSGRLNAAQDHIIVRFEARNDLFKQQAAGVPFIAYAMTDELNYSCRNYALEPGTTIEDQWPLDMFAANKYHLKIHGPNGSFWELRGDANDPQVNIALSPPPSGAESADAALMLESSPTSANFTVTLRDNAYGHKNFVHVVGAGKASTARMPTTRDSRWFDFSVLMSEAPSFSRRFAGRLETGAWSTSDPLIGS